MAVQISQEFRNSFNKAVADPININGDGSINWNFVDADLYCMYPELSNDEYMAAFNMLADEHEAKTKVSV